MKTTLKRVVEVVNVADFIAKLMNVYPVWTWFRDHIDLYAVLLKDPAARRGFSGASCRARCAPEKFRR